MDYTDTVKEIGFLNIAGITMPAVSPPPNFTSPSVGISTPGATLTNPGSSAGKVGGVTTPPPGANTGSKMASYSWITQGVGTLVGVAGNFFEKQMETDTARAISSGDQATKERIAQSSYNAEAFIQNNHDLTAIEIEKIRAIAAMNKPVDNSRNWIIIGVFSFLVVSTVGILYLGSRKSG